MKTIFKILIASLIGAILALFLISCGSRKVQKSESKEEIKIESFDNSIIEKQSESNIKQTSTIKVDNKDKSITSEETFEPIDPTKEASIIDSNGKKTILNNSKKTTKTEAKKNNTETIKESLTVKNEKQAVKEQKVVKQVNTSKKENSSKEVEKEPFNPFQLLYFIIPLLIIYIAYRKYKQLPLVPKF